MTGCPVHEAFDPLDQAFLRDPYAVMAELPPVFYAPSIDYYGRPAPAARAARPGRAVPNISFRGPQVLLVSSV